MAGFSTGLYYAGIRYVSSVAKSPSPLSSDRTASSLGWLYLFMGVLVSGAVIPATATLFLSTQSWAAATFSPPLATICALVGWLVHAKSSYGLLSLDSTGDQDIMLTGNLVSLLTPIVFIPILSFAFKSSRYDWKSMLYIKRDDESDVVRNDSEQGDTVQSVPTTFTSDAERKQLDRAVKIGAYLTIGLSLATLILWPMPMYGTGYIFSKRFFTGWIVVVFIWLFCSAICVGIYPLWEGRETCSRTIKAIIRDLSGGGRTSPSAVTTHGEVVAVGERGEEKEFEKDDEKHTETPPNVELTK